MGKKAICKKFRHPLKPGEQFNLTISYDVIDSFPERCEGMLHFVDYKTTKLRMEVNFHTERRCRNPKLFFRYGGEERELPPPASDRDGKQLWVEIHRPKVGATYEMEWEW